MVWVTWGNSKPFLMRDFSFRKAVTGEGNNILKISVL